MNTNYTLKLSDPLAVLDTVGGKGASLARLVAAGLPVPDGFHITTAAYNHFVAHNDLQPRILAALQGADPQQNATLEGASQAINSLFAGGEIPPEIASAIAHAYTSLPGASPTVAVRSSATAEDLPGLSFAGQQETYLNIQGIQAVLQAAQRCWASLWTARAISYRLQHNIDQNSISLAVVVQLLVPAEAAGIMFTANPINGQRSEAMITAAWGLGEAIVGGMVTPDTFVIEKNSRRILSREIAEKQVMTVRLAGGTTEQPVPEALRRLPSLSDAQAVDLALLGSRIEQLYAMPMDIEWALLDGQFSILQARPITALPQPAPAPLEWKQPHPKGLYMRGGVVDLMPNPLSPLFITLGLRTLKDQMYPLGEKLTHARPALTEDYYTTINGYAYQNAYMPPRTWWWALTALLPAYPRLLRGVSLWRDDYPQYQAAVARHQGTDAAALSAARLWQEALDITQAAMGYTTMLLFATMGASAGSESLLTQAYNKLAKQEGDPPATVLVMGYNNIPARAEKSLYDLAQWCKEQPALSAYLSETPTAQILAHLQQGEQADPVQGWQDFRLRLDQHLQQFGHIIYELDFSRPLPLDDPTPVLETCKMYLRGEGANPHQRQRAREQERLQTTQAILARLKGLRRWAFRIALNWGQPMAEVREDALSEIGLGYPILRRYLRELGRRLVEAGALQHPEEIFWLERREIEARLADLDRQQPLDSLAGLVQQRKAFWQRASQETPPPMIPYKKKIMGMNTELFTAIREGDQSGDTLKGVPTSPGKVTAPACVLRGPQDFDQMKAGDVIVAGTTTPAWTPLFAMASAVVTDIGGPLSHGSIVAREYGIPAVMGVGVATRRIRSGQVITVDGSAGTVTFIEKG